MLYKLQINYLFGMLGLLPFFPLLYWQGKRIRASVPDLGEAEEPQGSVGEAVNPFRLLAIGESAFAGVGVEKAKEGIVGQLANHFYNLSGRSITWEVLAKSGYTARQVTELLIPQVNETPYDLIVVGLGGNDTFNVNSPLRWYRDLERLIQQLRIRQPNAPVLFANLPPVGEFPAFTPALQSVFRRVSGRLDQALAQLVASDDTLWYCRKPIRFEEWHQRVEGEYSIADFFSDGVHPSAMTYQLWGEELADYVFREMKFEQLGEK